MLGARAADLLRQLDRRLLPPLAARLVRLGRAPVRMPVLAGAAAVSASAVLFAAAWVVAQQPGPGRSRPGVVRVGVTAGDTIPAYVDSSRSELKAMLTDRPPVRHGETYALVAFGAYLPPERLAPVLTGASVAAVFARAQGAGPDARAVRISATRLPDDVTRGMERAAGERESRAGQLDALTTGVRGAGNQYELSAATARAEATAYREHCACLYAAVVRARPAALNVILDRPEVRAVDPAPEVTRLDEAVFVPPLPEQRGTVTATPETTDEVPLPTAPEESPSPSGTPGSPAPQSTAGASPGTGEPIESGPTEGPSGQAPTATPSADAPAGGP
ncbi:hypothetical protein [Rhizomonospora bruguierae]|uniref:hypothetical protein n=1 Tax=Rhizomonospora bruguierae TaxID=1581705 RepID=UPI001BCABE59|nr:hypothetical protein [Micromonospora sp. NBRC 107566]